MAILTGDLRFDLASIEVYLQLMASLGVSGLRITDPKTKQLIVGIGEFLSQENDGVLMRGSSVISAMMPLVDRCIEIVPPRKPWYEVAADFSLLCKENKDLYSFGIEHQWLFERFDCSDLAFSDFPLHTRIGIGHHSGKASLEEQFLLADAFFLLARAEQAHALLMSYRKLTKGEAEASDLYPSLASLNLNVATYSRLSVVSFLAFLETLVNGVAHDYRVRNRSSLSSNDDESLRGMKKGSYLSLEAKLEVVPSIISGGAMNRPGYTGGLVT